MTQSQSQDRTPRRWRARPESWWWISAVVLIPVAALTGLTALLLVTTTHPGNASEQLDLVRTALSVGAGTGGVVALVLAGRRQWHAEQAQRATEQSHQAGEHDATQRRITDLYTKAADQLGSDKAPVRLAGLYALERVAQDNLGQRQTIVNVLCAYLRMPYTPALDAQPADGASREAREDYREAVQERQVRLTAQRILASHLSPGPNPDHPADTFWPDTSLDLTGATLIDLDLTGCYLHAVRFDRAQFVDDTRFGGARFSGIARFRWTKFTGNVEFGEAEFADDARFGEAQFADTARFSEARFAGPAGFWAAEFSGAARFRGTRFAGTAGFGEAQFADAAEFGEAEFAGMAWFGEAQFAGPAGFGKAQFADAAEFRKAKFAGMAWFTQARFTSTAGFGETQFADAAEFGEAEFAGMAWFGEAQFGDIARFNTAVTLARQQCWVRVDVPDDIMLDRVWPAGLTVMPTTERPRPDAEGKWGRLVRQPAPNPS